MVKCWPVSVSDKLISTCGNKNVNIYCVFCQVLAMIHPILQSKATEKHQMAQDSSDISIDVLDVKQLESTSIEQLCYVIIVEHQPLRRQITSSDIERVAIVYREMI